MPFCTACGRQNPDDARFCAQCGTRLVQLDDTGSQPAVGGGSGSTSDSTITFRAPVKGDAEERALNPGDAAAVDALPSGHALLVVQRGPSAGSRFLLDTDTVTAGRSPDSEIFLDDVTVSRRHAEFRRTGEGFTVRDVGSLNGTYVNRDRIDAVLLQGGDEVQIGKFRLVYFASQAGFGGQ
ncbi:FHA domain-containing protein [Nocardioides marmoribigeumensis]|jgi:pSer/pThr/pTyr-binding forkhead associated (FHA) protein|uniref:PSer/pThr/pTyr-binding forkhead associated (FHA) protein n=1 Tax=Nocardioides marmoribigeumensis TaxID=433649 RepID=A0ABU2C0W2_9ACTN|nr:FHA domain-containing protein [Nocardioides marmoribigeumensis]MDR7364303.1 pSer/pThr/pTyr-binding forkhead associated (FHA) protein [Nocardioides marmoribigeumensis]